MIDDVDFDVDGGLGENNHTEAYLILRGDFMEDFEEYIQSDATSISLRIDRQTAEKLVRVVSGYLG